MLKLIILKEIRSSVRDVRLQVSAALILILMISAVLVGKEGQRKIKEEREAMQSQMYDQWLNQDNKHPHSAAHYGQFAFKPKSVLSFLDVGLDNYTGVSVFLEAHKQNEILFSGAQDSNTMSRFGELTSALIFQLLMPLLIVFLTYNTFTKEREESTLKMLHAQGLSLKKLFLGKVLGNYIMVIALFIPIIILAYLSLDEQSASIDQAVGIKFIGLMIVYAAYFLLFVLLAVLVSAFSKNSGFALLSLLGVWIIACIILPKAATNMADKLYPTPSQFEFRKVIKKKVKNGIDGHNPSDKRLASLKQEVLNEYGVASIEELPVNWSGIAMQAGEEYTDQVYDKEFSNIEAIFQKQNRLSEWLGFINPYLAIRNLSMALAGTDFKHHVLFAKSAENYRRAFIKKMNKDMEINHKPDIAYADYKVGDEMWGQVEPFSYSLPSTATILVGQWRGIIAILLWLGALTCLFLFFSNKIPKIQS